MNNREERAVCESRDKKGKQLLAVVEHGSKTPKHDSEKRAADTQKGIAEKVFEEE